MTSAGSSVILRVLCGSSLRSLPRGARGSRSRPFDTTSAEFDNPFVAESILTRQDQRSPVLRRSFRKPYPAAVRGEDVYLWDADGHRYLDFCASAAVNFIGHGV